MALLDIWKELEDKRVSQLIGIAGDGQLRDGSTASKEFRELLRAVDADALRRFVDDCLTASFKDSGLALQDIVNEIGHRLGFDVTPGRYRGSSTAIGNDGRWESPEGHNVVVEVKTTDAYRIDLDVVAEYRRGLIRGGMIQEDASSILIVVGRQDTGDLEAQIRGSKHAWDVRLISVDALLRLLSVREELEDPSSEGRVRTILVPREYTRVDEIIDLVFSTAEDLLVEDLDSEGDERQDLDEPKPRARPVSFNVACAQRIGRAVGVDFVKRSRATFSTPNNTHGLVCAVSREYGDPNNTKGYWFAFHPHQVSFLEKCERSWVGFGCGSPEQILLFPLERFAPHLRGMNQTERADAKTYWHVQFRFDGSRWTMVQRAGVDWPDVTEYALQSHVPEARAS